MTALSQGVSPLQAFLGEGDGDQHVIKEILLSNRLSTIHLVFLFFFFGKAAAGPFVKLNNS
jgi:hypothetical protein